MLDLQEITRTHNCPDRSYPHFCVSVGDAHKLLDEIKRLRVVNHELRGLLETVVDTLECGGSFMVPDWWEKTREVLK